LGYKLRRIETESKFSSQLTLEAIERAVPLCEIKAILTAADAPAQRERKLNMVLTVLLMIAMNLYSHLSIGEVMRKIARGLRYIWPDPEYQVASDSAISYRRYQLGARPLVTLFHQVCRPKASLRTPGAFLFGLRLMAIDGSTEDVPDTPGNAAVFGRHHASRGDSAFPQVEAVYLVECGTHALVDAGFWPCHTSERVGGGSHVALGRTRHAGHVGPRLSRLRHDSGGSRLPKPGIGTLAYGCQTQNGAAFAGWLVPGLPLPD
jgi:hypothetical protein